MSILFLLLTEEKKSFDVNLKHRGSSRASLALLNIKIKLFAKTLIMCGKGFKQMALVTLKLHVGGLNLSALLFKRFHISAECFPGSVGGFYIVYSATMNSHPIPVII